MTSKKVTEVLLKPNLLVSRSEAKERILKQISKGDELRNLNINSNEDFEKALSDKTKWKDYTSELLGSIFENEYYSKDFRNAYGPMFMASSFQDRYENYINELNAKITNLESLVERLELIRENYTETYTQTTSAASLAVDSEKIFLVHGHDENLKNEVSIFLRQLDLEYIILHEQPNGGKTLIEKLEHHSDVKFAIVLMTPDDIGSSKDQSDNPKPRARQNVLMELGYFMGKLKRKSVCAVYKEVEIPSDFLGVLYIQHDANGAWKFSLAKEMKEAGLKIDLNKII